MTDSDRFGYFVRITADEFPGYFRAMRGRTEKLEIGAAERFARDWVARHVTAHGALLQGAEPVLIDHALQRSGLNGLALVVAAFLAISLGRFEDAEVLAGRATAADQHETFAQRLQLAARERSPSLRLEVDDWLQDRVCPNPFTTVEIIGSRDVYTCCAAWMPAKLGRADDGEPVWDGARAAEIRRSVLDGDFGYCSRVSCPRIAGRNLPRRDEAREPALRRAIDYAEKPAAPRRVLLSYDESCNLSCPSCRSALVLADKAATEELDAFFDLHVTRFLEDAAEIKVTGSGDPFGSRHFRRVLGKIASQDAQGPRLQLQTNGLLFDRRAWDELHLAGHVRSVWVSVDAATPETYAKLRRGGDFQRLVKNLEMLGKLRAEGAFAEFRLDFVVQYENFAELEDFVAMARRVGADRVHLLQLRNWGTFQPEEFRALEVARPDHPNHADLLKMLARPCFGDKFVDLGNLTPLRATNQASPSVRTNARSVRQMVVFGAARTGTNFLFQGLRSFRELVVFSELFNSAGGFGLERYHGEPLRRLAELDGVAYAGERDRRLVARIRANPVETLHELTDFARSRRARALVYKLFPGQIEQAKTLNRIIGDPTLAPIVVSRRALEMFVSLLKARKTQAWHEADTTHVKVSFALGEFVSWYQQHAEWYRTIGEGLASRGLSPLLLDYEDFTTWSEEQFRAQLASYLNGLGLDVEPPGSLQLTLTRQDRTKDVFERFDDPDRTRDILAGSGYLSRALARFEI